MITNPNTWQSYRFDEIEKAPRAIGIYAWYGILNVGPMDWKDEDIEMRSGENSLRNVLFRHTQRFRPQELATHARRNWHVWKGRLKDDRFQKFVDLVIKNNAAAESVGNKQQAELIERDRATLNAALVSDANRGALVRILAAAAPVLSAPIYIGQTDNLRRRLSNHKASFLNVRSIQMDDTSQQATERDLDVSFATRAVNAGFTSENLVVYTLNVDEFLKNGSHSQLNRKQITKSAEILLNNWARPILGKR